jgi:hypothetical protein
MLTRNRFKRFARSRTSRDLANRRCLIQKEIALCNGLWPSVRSRDSVIRRSTACSPVVPVRLALNPPKAYQRSGDVRNGPIISLLCKDSLR